MALFLYCFVDETFIRRNFTNKAISSEVKIKKHLYLRRDQVEFNIYLRDNKPWCSAESAVILDPSAVLSALSGTFSTNPCLEKSG